MIVECKDAKNEIMYHVGKKVRQLKELGITPHVASINIGGNEASKLYQKSQAKKCEINGIIYHPFTFDLSNQEINVENIEELIFNCNKNKNINAIMIQTPIDARIDQNHLFSLIAPEKDVDCLNPINAGKLFLGDIPAAYPCTPAGIMYLIENIGFPLKGAKVVVVGRSNIVGKPLAAMLMQQGATVTICHSKTSNYHFKHESYGADLVISATGKANLIKPGMVRSHVLVIDAGISYVDGKVCGDCSPNIAEYSDLTPVPGGVGILTSAMFLNNIVDLTYKQNGLTYFMEI